MTIPAKKVSTIFAVAALAATGALSGCSDIDIPDPTAEESGSSTATGSASNAPSSGGSTAGGSDSKNVLHNGLSMNEAQARTSLDALPVEEAHSMSGYSRDAFPHWYSANEWGWTDVPYDSGCDSREAALARDGEDVVSDSETCRADEGTWNDPYTDEVITDSSEVDIDHVVPLAAAWRAGADEWNEEQRTIFANAPLVTVASGASSNREKGDKGPEAWKPEDRSSWCVYSLRWIAVKNEYGLNLTSEGERDALREMLDTCSDSSA